MGVHEELERCEGFEWDDGNRDKNWRKHRVTDGDAEQVFFNEPLILASDVAHSDREIRYFALGRTGAGRRLYVAFAVRRNCIRVISARDMTRRELRRYNNA